MSVNTTRSASIADRLDTINMNPADRDLAKDQVRFVEAALEAVASGLANLRKLAGVPAPAPARRMKSA